MQCGFAWKPDVEVAAYLSGGIDPVQLLPIKDIEPEFSIHFPSVSRIRILDESKFQEEAVRYLNTNHRAISCTSKEIAEVFPRGLSPRPCSHALPLPRC